MSTSRFEHIPGCAALDSILRCDCGADELEAMDNPLRNYCAQHDIYNCPYAHAPNPDHVDDGRLYTINLEHEGEPVDINDIPDGTAITLIMPHGNQHGVWRNGRMTWDSEVLNEIEADNTPPVEPDVEGIMQAWRSFQLAFTELGDSVSESYRRMARHILDSTRSDQRPLSEFLEEADELITSSDEMRAHPDMEFDNLGLLVEDER